MGARIRRPELIIFDLDGTLIDTETVSLEAWLQVNQEYNLGLSREDFLAFVGRNAQAVLALGESLVPGGDFPAIYERKKNLARQIFDRDLRVKPGARELVAHVKDLGIACCVATSSTKDRSWRMLQRVGLADAMDFLVSGEEVVHSKPHPEIFLRCLDKTGVSIDRALIVEDSDTGLQAAKATGAFSILIPDIVPVSEAMEKSADLILESLFDLKEILE